MILGSSRVILGCSGVIVQCSRKYCLFAFWCENWQLWWIKRHPVSRSNMLFSGISRYLELNFELSLLWYFFAWTFCLCYFLHFLQIWSKYKTNEKKFISLHLIFLGFSFQFVRFSGSHGQSFSINGRSAWLASPCRLTEMDQNLTENKKLNKFSKHGS